MKLRIPDPVAASIRGMHPHLKKKVRAGLEDILDDPSSGKPLREKLKGLHSFRIGKTRIIYRMQSAKVIEIVAIGPRRSIYEATYRLIRE